MVKCLHNKVVYFKLSGHVKNPEESKKENKSTTTASVDFCKEAEHIY